MDRRALGPYSRDSDRQVIWLPSWCGYIQRRRNLEGVNCCCEFCWYYHGQGGERPSLRTVCPLFFRDRPDRFRLISRRAGPEFRYIPWNETATQLFAAQFTEDSVIFRISLDTNWASQLDTFRLFRDNRDDTWTREDGNGQITHFATGALQELIWRTRTIFIAGYLPVGAVAQHFSRN